MIKILTRFSRVSVVALLMLLTGGTINAQVFNDGCMRIRPYVHDSWLQEFEDPFQADEVALQWYAADNADLDGQGYRSDYGFLYLTGSNYIGWRTIFEGGDDDAAAHPMVNLFDHTYGTVGTTFSAATPQYLRIRGTYTGDDCGGASGCSTGFPTCITFDDDDYCYDDVLTNTFNYRFSPPNQNIFTSDVFTNNHGGNPPTIGGGSNFGARIGVNWSSPIPFGIVASPSTSVCAGGSITLTATGGTVQGGTYSWYTSTGTFVGVGTSISVSPLANTTYRVYCRNGGIDGLCFKDINVFASSNPIVNNNITPSAPVGPFCNSGNPGIVTGNTPNVSLPTWSYQWETSTDGGGSWTNWGNVSSAVLPYQFDPANTTQTLLVRRVVFAGGCDNASNVLTYVIEPSIGNNTIAGDQTLCGAGIPISLTGSVPTGGAGNYFYQWQSATSIGGPYTDIGGANGQNYAPNTLTQTTYFRRTVSGGVCPPSTSNVITVTIQPVITGNTISADQVFCVSGNPANLVGTGTLAGGDGSFTYQWQQSTDGGVTWSATGGLAANYNPPVITQTTLYRRGVYSGVCSDNSNIVTVTVHPAISNNTISADQASCGSFTAATIVGTIPAGGNGSYTYTWEESINGGGTWTTIGGAISANYSPGTVAVTTLYRRNVNSLPCTSVSNIVTITITPPITVNTIGSDQTFCVSGTPATLTGPVPTGGNGSFTYQWQSSPDGFNWTNIGGATAIDYSPGVITSTTYFHRIAYSGSCSLTSNMVTITIVPAITANSVSADQSFCGSDDPALLIGSTPSGGTGVYTYLWYSSTDNITFSPIGGAINQNYDPGNVTVTTYFYREVTSSVCSSNSNVVTITVVPVINDNTIDSYQRFCDSGDPAIINGSTPTGGTGSYTYSWEISTNGITWTPVIGANGISYDPPATSVTVYYHRIVTSSVCSSTSNTSTVLVLDLPQITQVTHTDVLCNGGNTGTISVTGISSNGPVQFSIDGGATYQSSGSFAGLIAGSYFVFITDDSACVNSYTGNPEVVSEPAVLNHTTTPQNASCDNVFDGSITVNTTGGVVPYIYSLNGGPSQSSNVFSGLASGTYTVLVTDDNGCTSTSSVFLDTAYAVYASLVSQTPVSCFGGVDGTVTVELTGGVPPYSYSINGVQFVPSSTFTGLASGNYVITLRDSKGCTDFVNVTITQPAQLTAQLDSVMTIGCNGASSGGIYITVTGGNPAYSFLWSNGAVTEDITGLVAGTYNVAITDSKGCTTSVGATLSQPLPLFINIASYQDLLCYNDSSGAIDITVNGGVPPYSFAWSNAATTEDIYNILPGTYSVTVTDANGCNETISQTVSEPTQLTSTISATQVLCAGAASGNVDLEVNGGTTPYNYVWNNGATGQDLTGVSGGTYTVVIYDANGCSIVNSTVVTEPAAIAITVAKTDVLCSGGATGAIDITVTGGQSPYDYTWSNSAITQDLTGLTAGVYAVTVKDANNCTATVSVTITEVAGMVLNSSVDSIACANGTNGAIDITVQGGTFPYTYLWSNSATTEDIFGLVAGTYTVTVTDANGCTITAVFTLSQPNGMTSSIVGTDVTCNGASNGAANLTVSGGTTPYNFLWSTFQGTEDVSGLTGGLFYVIVTDAKGCEIKDSVFIAEPQPIVLTTVVTNISCFNANDGAIDLSVTGGTPNYTYLWSNSAATQDVSSLPGGQYVVTVTDAQNCTATASVTIVNPSAINANFITKNPLCNGDTSGRIDLLVSGGTPVYNFLWSNGAVTEDLVNVGAGTYIVTITDSRNCNHVDSATIVEPGQIFTSGVVKNVSCNGLADGFVDITAYAGTLPYTYKWSTLQSTEDIFNVPGGDYYVTVTDINGCEAVSLYIIKEPLPLGIGIAKTDVRCYGEATGTLAVLPTGGTTPYYYLWNNFATDSLLLGVEAGHYIIQLTDSNGCFIYDSVDVTQPSEINIAATLVDALCYGAADADIDVTTTGGTPSYSFNWSNSATTEDLIGVVAGTYTITVTDGNVCQKTATFTVGEGPQIISSLAALDPICNGGNTGSITAITSGGVQPYNYAWSNSKTTVAIGTLVAGTYTLTITDAANCTVTSSAVLNNPAAITVSANAQGAKCFNTASGQVTAFVTGGFAPYNYMLNGVAQSNDTFTNLLPGQYLLLVTDVNGCQGSASFSVSSPSDISVDLNVTEQVILTGMQTQLIATATSDTTILNYFWSPDSIGSSIFDYSGCGDPLNCSNPKVAPRTTTVFTVLVMNADSCYASDTVTVYVDNELSAFIPSAFTPNGDGLNDRFEFDILGATNVEVSVFNRWGQRIYYNPSQANKMNVGNDGWDGTVDGRLAPFDTYVYQIKVNYMQDYVLSEKDFTGTVTLMK
ncbi:MAG TPA: gliding motility-associated C-terminal domain-containing protein [Chitinophagales bacterium]|nr:gliding motility-associated C-terminal domain-containing protein [Chitinophagales bacterium]